MFAVFRREFSAYFHSPLGYMFVAVYFLFAGIYFTLGSLLMDTADMTQVFSSMFSIMLFLVPILTMRLLSEDRKNKTDQALLTAPVSLTGVVVGKFLAAMAVYVIGLAITLVYALIIAIFASPDWPVVFGNFLALLLLGMALIAIGMFISSLTENQFVAAVGGFAAGLFLLLADAMRSIMSSDLLKTIVGAMSFYDRYSGFTAGMLSLSDLLYFFSVAFIFLFLTVRVFERRRWS